MEQLNFILQAFQLVPFGFAKAIFLAGFDKITLKKLPNEAYLFWLALFICIALVSLFQYYRNLLKARIIEDTPTAKIRSAAQGYSEIEGKQSLLENHPIIAPLSLIPCTWYAFSVYKKNKNSYTLISQGESNAHFLIKDLTGKCVVDPLGADVQAKNKDSWYGFSANPQGKSKHIIILVLGFIFGGYYYKESRMDIDSAIYALGNFSTIRENNSEINIISKKGLTARQPFLISNFTQEKLIRKYRIYSILWLGVFLIFMPYSLWWLSIKL